MSTFRRLKLWDRLLRALGHYRIERSDFYQKYPYQGGCRIVDVDQRGAIDLSCGFFYNRIPKAANSTVIVNLIPLRAHSPLTSAEAKRSFMQPSQLMSHQMQAFEELLKFTVVRNPFTRTLSAYLDKIARGKKRISPPKRAHSTDTPPSFVQFCRYLAAGGLYKNAHWAPQIDLLLIPSSAFDFIIKTENLATDLPHVLSRLRGAHAGRPMEPHLLSHVPHKTGAADKVNRFYTDECKDVVRQLYAEDFQNFEYSTEL